MCTVTFAHTLYTHIVTEVNEDIQDAKKPVHQEMLIRINIHLPSNRPPKLQRANVTVMVGENGIQR